MDSSIDSTTAKEQLSYLIMFRIETIVDRMYAKHPELPKLNVYQEEIATISGTMMKDAEFHIMTSLMANIAEVY